MNTAAVIYLGDLRTECEHLQSGTKIITDAPTDNFGKGQAFSPTDLAATSLATCMLTTVAIKTRDENIYMSGCKVSEKKIMTNNPRKISRIEIVFEMPDKTLTEDQKERI